MADLEIEVEWDHVTTVNVTQASNGQSLVNGPARLAGWSVRETTGAAVAFMELSSGQSIIGEASMPAGQNDSHYTGSGGVYCPQGVTVSAIGGSFTGCVYLQIYKA